MEKCSCQICGKPFWRIPANVKKSGGKFCSRKCYGVWRKTNWKGKNAPNWKGGEVKLKCLMCGKGFSAKPASVKRGGGKFCSVKCMGGWNSKHRTGKNSPCWKGGISPSTKLIRFSIKYKEWRQRVFIRDDFTCQECRGKGYELRAHHIKPFHKLIEDVRQYLPLFTLYDGAMLYTPLWDISNGVTLCEKCHNTINNREEVI